MQHIHNLSRRHFFKQTGLAAGRIALAGMLWPEIARGRGGGGLTMGAAHPALPGLPHFAPKAKRLIYLFMNGGPSQIDLLDYKPNLTKIYDTDLPDSIRMGQRLTTMTSGFFALCPLTPEEEPAYKKTNEIMAEIFPLRKRPRAGGTSRYASDGG